MKNDEDKPFYDSSRAEEYLNFMVGSADTYPQGTPQSRLESYLKYMCEHPSGGEGTVLIDVGREQISYDGKIFPKISKEKATEIYETYSSGACVIIRWNVMGILPIEATVLGTDNVAGVYKFDVVIHNEYLCEYTYTDASEETEENIIKLGGSGGGGITIDLLWENASPNSEFPAQTLNMDFSQYDYILITFKSATRSGARKRIISKINEYAIAEFSQLWTSPYFSNRIYELYSDHIYIQPNYKIGFGSSTASTDNSIAILLTIEGIKL